MKLNSYEPRPGHFEWIRPDGVRFLADTHSPNGMAYHATDAGPGYMVTAGDDFWGSVPVGRFGNICAVAAVCMDFDMPDRTSAERCK
jgi:hypothetical protein